MSLGFQPEAWAHEESVPLQDDLGNHTYPISTSVPLAQRYFDQGLILSYGFNHAESAQIVSGSGPARSNVRDVFLG